MAREPENMVIRLLREIQSTQADHTRTLTDHTKRFKKLEKRLHEVSESMVTAHGLAGHANVRHESVERRLEEIEDRLHRLEEKA